MKNRKDYDLPPFEGPEDKKPPKKPEDKKGPMPDDLLIPGWDGDDAEFLKGMKDMLPEGVRACPRAHLVPPSSETAKQAHSKKFKGAKGNQKDLALLQEHKAKKRKLEDTSGADTATSSSGPTAAPFNTSYPPPSFPRPPEIPGHGLPDTTSYNWNTGEYLHTHPDKFKWGGPALVVAQVCTWHLYPRSHDSNDMQASSASRHHSESHRCSEAWCSSSLCRLQEAQSEH